MNTTYTYERCDTLEQVTALTAKYAAQGLVPGGPPTKFGSGYGIAFVARSSGRNKPFNITRGWPTENPLYTLGKVGVGLSQHEPKKRVEKSETPAALRKREAAAELKRKFIESFNTVC